MNSIVGNVNQSVNQSEKSTNMLMKKLSTKKSQLRFESSKSFRVDFSLICLFSVPQGSFDLTKVDVIAQTDVIIWA